MGMAHKFVFWLVLLGLPVVVHSAEDNKVKDDKVYFTPLSTIHSAPLDVQPGTVPGFGATPPSGPAPAPGFSAGLGGLTPGGLFQLARPVAVAAWNEYVFVADEGHQAILRYDRVRDRFVVFYKMRVTPQLRMTATINGTLYITDPANRQVLQVDNTGFAGTGVLARTFRDFNLQKPMAVAEDNVRGRILILDGMQNLVMAFNRLGRLQQVMRPVEVRGLTLTGLRDLAVGPDGLYLLDSVLRKVVITDFDGRFITSFGSEVLQQPSAIAIDSEKRVVVADAFSSRLQIFILGASAALLQTVSETTSVMQLSDIAVVDDYLYVADTAGSRVIVMRVEHPAVSKP